MPSNQFDQSQKRQRIVVSKPSHNYCKVCRLKKVKCDGARPQCYRCIQRGVSCAYDSWTLAFSDTPATERSHQLVAMDARVALRAQMLSKFLEDCFPAKAPFAPYIGHTIASSLPHLWAQTELPTPLVQHAIDTVGLVNLASQLRISWLIDAALDHRGRLLHALRNTIASYYRLSPSSSRPRESPTPAAKLILKSNTRSVMMTIMLLSVMPPLPGDSEKRQSVVHLEGVLQFLSKCETDSLLTGDTHTDAVLIRQLQEQVTHVTLARRKHLEFQKSTWLEIPRQLLGPEMAIYCESGFLDSQTTAKWQQLASYPEPSLDRKNLVRDMADPLPAFLEMADKFARTRGPHSQQSLDDIAYAVQRAHALQLATRPVSAAGRILWRAVSNRDLDFDPDIEEHVYLLDIPIFDEHFQYDKPLIAYLGVTMRLCSLLTDCAILQVLCTDIGREQSEVEWTGVGREQVKKRAHQTALEICQHVHYISNQSLTAARFLRSWITASRNFFESCGRETEWEMRWCDGCIAAITRRIARSEAVSLCPMIETWESMVEGFRFRRFADRHIDM